MRRNRSEDVLQRALGAWRRESRECPPARLGEDARRAVVRGGFERADGDPSPSALFPTLPWRGLAWTVPALLVAVLVLPIALSPRIEEAPSAEPVGLRVAKVDGKVVFTIENGGRPHRVSKSSDPGRFAADSDVPVTDGSFEDAADGGPALVFYRIE